MDKHDPTISITDDAINKDTSTYVQVLKIGYAQK